MDVLRTPDERFADLPDFDFVPRYVTVTDAAATPPGGLRIHHVDEGPAKSDVIVLLHGEPSWSYVYRHVIPPLVEAGHRVVAPDLVGFGRPDKPADIADHSNDRHVAWIVAFLDALGLDRVTWVGHDWGGLIGLRIMAAQPDRFVGFVGELPAVWHAFRRTVNTAPELDIARLVRLDVPRDRQGARVNAPRRPR